MLKRHEIKYGNQNTPEWRYWKLRESVYAAYVDSNNTYENTEKEIEGPLILEQRDSRRHNMALISHDEIDFNNRGKTHFIWYVKSV